MLFPWRVVLPGVGGYLLVIGCVLLVRDEPSSCVNDFHQALSVDRITTDRAAVGGLVLRVLHAPDVNRIIARKPTTVPCKLLLFFTLSVFGFHRVQGPVHPRT